MLNEVTVKELRDSSFYEKDGVQFVMFFGATCGPCKATMPHYEEAAKFFTERGANIEFYKFNAWEPEEHNNYGREDMGVEGVPTFLAFFDNQEIYRDSGTSDYETMCRRIHSVIDIIFKAHQIKI